MRFSKHKEKNIFCIEGDWTNSLKDRSSIKTALEFLEHNSHIRTAHRNCSTIEEFDQRIKTSLQKAYSKYGIIYLAFHGTPGSINVGKRKKLAIEEIAEMVSGKAEDKIIHFGSCSTLDVSGWDLRRFLETTGALAVSGYKTDIDFIPSTFLDMLYFEHCQYSRKMSTIETNMNAYHRKLMNKLGFVIKYLK
ncbi:MAG: DUF6642 family protein [Bacteroidota bacterium]